MPTPNPFLPGCPLEEIIITQELGKRTGRSVPAADQQVAVNALTEAMASTPERVLAVLADQALRLCAAHSAGISVEDLSGTPPVFRWHAVAGRMASFVGGTMPRDFSPCGETVARRETVLMRGLIRHYPYAAQLNIGMEEALLVPFFIGGRAVGTVWILAHDTSRIFTAEEARVLERLSEFAAAAVTVINNTSRLASSSARLEKLAKAYSN